MREYWVKLIGYSDGVTPRTYAMLKVFAPDKEGAVTFASTLADGRDYRVQLVRQSRSTESKVRRNGK